MRADIPGELTKRLAAAQSVCVLTGSGVSAESGVPTFRDAQTGLWAKFQPEELATMEAFQRDPSLVWEWYQWRRKLVRQARPNPAHSALADLEQMFPHFSLISQNVDGLHQAAGSRNMIEFHGNIMRTICADEGCVIEDYDASESPPPCPNCGAYLRPDVVWFGEQIDKQALDAAIAYASACDVFFAIGTSAQVQPAAGLAELAIQSGACMVEINPQQTLLSDRVSYAIHGNAAQVLPALIRALRGRFRERKQ
ncbi:MAG: NAD-dependent deacylase [Gammaproteobacteria bacterium]|nr:NAD-dependent deacylase [Gammaproteobacteria bacterium]MCZ6717474.1 NAD-dependent deacylase [Gammaproteobacteria bacterium]